MSRKNNTGRTAAILGRQTGLILLFMLVLSLMLAGCQATLNPNDLHLQKSVVVGDAVSENCMEDPIMSLLGKSFDEIKQLLGEPYDQGSGDWLGTHNYIQYRFEKSFIQFFSPESKEDGIVVSILLGPGLVVLGAQVGMNFQEITDILGEPDLGPELGMDDLYYADYFGGEINNGVPDIFISFVAFSMDSPTEYALVKWENSNDEETERLQIEK